MPDADLDALKKDAKPISVKFVRVREFDVFILFSKVFSEFANPFFRAQTLQLSCFVYIHFSCQIENHDIDDIREIYIDFGSHLVYDWESLVFLVLLQTLYCHR